MNTIKNIVIFIGISIALTTNLLSTHLAIAEDGEPPPIALVTPGDSSIIGPDITSEEPFALDTSYQPTDN